MPDVIGNLVPENSVKVSFSHPLDAQFHPSGDLNIYINPDQIVWAYGLNTQSYPTYGGEVVQILSVYFDDMTVSGTVRTYTELENIYSWFISYMQVATQGTTSPIYNQQPVTFNYYERNWVFNIWPRSLPGFRYGRDVVAPTWTLQAAVKEPETSFSGAIGTTLSDQIMNKATFDAQYKGQFQTFGVATADFGSTSDLQNNPFAASDAPAAVQGNVAAYLTKEERSLGDTFTSFLGDWSNTDLSALPQFQNVSIPAQVKSPSSGAKSQKSTKTGK